MSDWQEASLADLADYINGRAIKPEECSTQQGIPVIRIKQINDPQSIEDRFFGDDLDEKNIARSGDLLFSWSATLKTILWQGPTGAINQHIFKVLPKDGIDKIFLHYLIDHSLPALTEESHGSTMKHIKKSALSAFHIPIPPLPEQKKIAEILSGIDKAISIKNIRHEKRKTTAIRILDALLSETESRQVPLSKIALLERGKFSHRPRNDPAYYGGEFPFIQTGDIPKAGIRISEHKQTLNRKGLEVSRQFPKGTLVITIAATIGEVGILSYPACFPDSLVGITPNTEECDPVFLLYSLRRLKDKLLQMAPQSAQSNLNLEILGRLTVPLPPQSEQKQFSRMIVCEDARASAETIGIMKLQHMKTALSADLLSGRKRVSI